MSSTKLTVAAAAVAALAALPAASGELAVEAHAGYQAMAAENTASALFDSTGAATFGGAVRYTAWRGAFVSAGARTFAQEGERVFVAGVSSPVQKLGFPLSIRVTTGFLTVGYRFWNGGMVVPYVGGGGVYAWYSEQSDVTGEAFDDERSKGGLVGMAGVEVGRGLLRFGAEAGYTSVPDAIGFGGVSRVYGEDDLGGSYVLGKVIVAF
jgi:hypothetical protein